MCSCLKLILTRPSSGEGKKKRSGIAITTATTFPPLGYQPTPINTLLANALDLTAPASDVLLRNRKNSWVQLAGHPGCFAPAGPHTIWKRQTSLDDSETCCYQSLMKESLRSVVPKFYRQVEFNEGVFIEIEDLLQHFHDPNIMDIKMGSRTFLESEVTNQKLRTDLYEKMVTLDATEPTQAEHENAAVTKLRYMQFRERGSSSATLGFRIDAIRLSGQVPCTGMKKVRTKEEVTATITRFVEGHTTIYDKFLLQLQNIRRRFEESKYFKHHEIIGSSLLLLCDKNDEANIWMIDFAKTQLVSDRSLSHRAVWSPGNHEDGFLVGMDNLIQVMSELCKQNRKMDSPSKGNLTLAHSDKIHST